MRAGVDVAGDEQVDEVERTVTIPVRAPAAPCSRSCALLDDAGIGVEDVAVRRPTLDDVFLQLTGHAAEEATEDAEDEPTGRKATKGAAA